MAPIIAIGSTALVAGTAASAGATAKKAVSPSIKICEVAPGAFHFALNGSVVTFNGSCHVFAAKIGINHVTEVSAPALYRSLSSISVAPAQVRVNSSLKTESIALRLAAGKSATVTFANSKLVVVVSGPAPVTPPPSNPSPSAGGSSGGSGGGGGSGGPGPGASTGGPGYIEICKTAGDGMVEGTFSFTVSEGDTAVGNGTYSLTPVYGVTANTVCTGAISAPAGTVTITEASYGPGYGVSSVTSAPTGTLASWTAGSSTATFTVNSGFETTADFVNSTQLNLIKVCKVLVNNLGNLAGTTFGYTVGWTFTPSTPNLTTAYFTGSDDVSVVALASPNQACSLVPEGIPAGSVVTVTENPSLPNSNPFVTVTGITYDPPQFQATTSTTPATEAVLTVPPVTDGYADAVFWNTPMGYVEVCKNFDPWWYNNKYNFATFTVNGGSPFSVQGGDCSAPIEVPAGAGTAVITETLAANYYFEGVTAIAAVESAGPINELVTAPTANPATVNVPYGDVGNETVVTYTDGVDPTSIKVCATDPGATPDGQTVDFSWQYVDSNPNPETPDVGIFYGKKLPDLTITTSDPTPCEYFNGPPVLDPEGYPYVLTITENSISGSPGVEVTGISYQGNGSASDDTAPGLPASITITLGLGTNAVTFTNGPIPV